MKPWSGGYESPAPLKASALEGIAQLKIRILEKLQMGEKVSCSSIEELVYKC